VGHPCWPFDPVVGRFSAGRRIERGVCVAGLWGVVTERGRQHPVELCPAPWPDVESEDPLGEIGRRFVLRVREAINDKSIRSVARDAGLSHATLDNVLAGRTWPDLATIGRLELALGVPLGWHSS
jgi:DNA-binding phage protein